MARSAPRASANGYASTGGSASVLVRHDRAPVVLLTSNLPRPRSEGDLALRAAGPGIVFAGRGWLIPLADCYALLFIVLLSVAAVRVWRGAPAERRVPGRARIAASRA